MSRPIKAVVEYFSHKCRHGRVIFVLESLWGNDGYSFFYKIYELLGDSEGHVFDLRKSGNWDYLLTYTRLNGDIVDTMLAKLVDLGIIDGDLLKERVIWSQCFVDDLEDVYSRRKVSKPDKPDLCQQKPESTGNPSDNPHTNPQSKVKYSKVKKNYTSDSIEFGLSEYLFSLIKARSAGHKEPNFQTWAKHVDQMIRIDNRDPDKIRTVIDWCQSHRFWRDVILSTDTLREKYDRLVLQMRGTNSPDEEPENPVDAEKRKRGLL